jgi:hypothetical protein
MPTIVELGSYKITIYFEDEPPPHVHVVAPDWQAKVRISDAKVFVGKIPPAHRKEALAGSRRTARCCWRSGMNTVEDTLPRVRDVHAVRTPWTLNVVWADGTKSRVDLTGLIYRSRHFKVFLEEPAAFRKVHVADFGGGVEWDNGLDYGADTLKTMADEQRPITGTDLKAFESERSLTTAETANLLGLSQRTIRSYRMAAKLPHAVAIAIRALEANNTMLAAHYQPAGQIKAGRPKRVDLGELVGHIKTRRPLGELAGQIKGGQLKRVNLGGLVTAIPRSISGPQGLKKAAARLRGPSKQPTKRGKRG